MFPNYNIELNDIEKTPNQEQKMGRSFLFDFETGDFVLKDGKVVEIDGIKALEVWIEKILRTEKFKFEVYKKEDRREYGVTIMELIVGEKYPLNFLYSEIEREVKEALLNNTSIEDIKDFKLDKIRNKLDVSFTVISKIGIFKKGVTFNGRG